jgi:hypothetical protein
MTLPPMASGAVDGCELHGASLRDRQQELCLEAGLAMGGRVIQTPLSIF